MKTTLYTIVGSMEGEADHLLHTGVDYEEAQAKWDELTVPTSPDSVLCANAEFVENDGTQTETLDTYDAQAAWDAHEEDLNSGI